MINADRHFGLQVGEFVFAGKLLDLRRRVRRFGRGSETRAGRARIRYEDPDEAVLLLAGIAAGINAIHFETLIRRERRDELALSIVNVELPAVISAFQIFSIEAAAVERHASMRAGVAQGKWLSQPIAADD